MRQFERTELLIGEEALEKLKNSNIAVFGCGGVGSFVIESLIRSGIGNITLVDFDIIDITNLNRQLHATLDNVGEVKIEAIKKRLLSINPELNIKLIKDTFTKENSENFINYKDYDYIVDAIDMISSKIELVLKCNEFNIPIISSMGTGNKLDPTKLELCDLYKTFACPLAKVMRKELKRRRIKKLKVVYSKENPIKVEQIPNNLNKRTIGSVSFVPSVAGLIISSAIVNDLII